MTIDPKSRETALAYLDLLESGARKNFEEDGYVAPAVMLLTMVNPETGEISKTSDPYVVPLMAASLQNDYEKDAYAQAVKIVALKLDAFAFVFIAESWWVHATAETQEQVLRERNKHGSLEHVRGRKECVQILFEHCAFPNAVLSRAIITRQDPDDEKSPGTVGLFERLFDGKQSGRWTHVLPGYRGD